MAIISAEFTFALISDAAIAASRGLFRHNEWRLLGRRRFASFRIMSRDFGDFDPELVCLGDCSSTHWIPGRPCSCSGSPYSCNRDATDRRYPTKELNT